MQHMELSVAYCQLYSSPPDKMAAILADDNLWCIFLNENDRIPIEFHWNLFPGVQLKI